MEELRIYLFGGLLLESGGHSLPPIPSRTGRSLFAYLVTHRELAPTRDLLAGLFWPDMPEPQARRRLSQALWQIQSVLGEAGADQEMYLQTSPTMVRFNPRARIWVDVEAFELAVGALKDLTAGDLAPSGGDLERLRRAVELYRGDFLAGFYDDWLLLDQQRLRDTYYTALDHLIRLSKSQGDFEQALLFARRLALHDPVREEAHREVMRLCFLLGRANEALQQYDRCRAILLDELGTQPAPPTTLLRNHIATQRDTEQVPMPPAAQSRLFEAGTRIALVGRERERERIVTSMERTLGGSGGIVLIEGEAGVGKTRFLQELADDAAWRGLGVMWGECAQEGATRPYQGLTSAFAEGLSPLRAVQLSERLDDVWLRELARIVPALEEWLPDLPAGVPLRPAEEPARMWETIAQAVVALGSIAPLVMVLDDFHEADADTVRAVEYLGRRLGRGPVLLCVSYRSQEARRRPEVWSALRSLDSMPGGERTMLAPLSPGETGELLRRITAQPAAPGLVQRLADETGGNPLFVLETLRALHERSVSGVLDPTVGLEGIEVVPISSTVAELVGKRLDSLPPESRHVLAWFAVRSTATVLEPVLAASGMSRSGFLEALDTLVGRGVLEESEGRYRFSHALVRRVAYDSIEGEERRTLHGRLAEALHRLEEGGVEELAHHYAEAERWGPAAEWLERAGLNAIEARAYANAAGYFERAVEAAERATPAAAGGVRLLEAWEETLDVLGRREEQRAVVDRLASSPDADRAAVLLRRSWLAANTDRFEEARAAALDALELTPAERDPHQCARALRMLATIDIWSGNPSRALPYLEQAIELAPEGSALAAEARCALGNALAGLQEYDQAETELRRAITLFERTDDRRWLAEALGTLAVVNAERGDANAAEQLYRRARQTSAEIGYRHGEGTTTVNLAVGLYLQGRLMEALDLYQEALVIFAELGNRRGQAMVLANSAELRYLLLGDDVRAEEDARRALEIFDQIGDARGASQALDILAGLARRGGDYAAAAQLLDRALDALAGSPDTWLQAQSLGSKAQLACDSGRPGAGLAACDEALALCRQRGMQDLEVALLSLRGRCLLELGDPEAAVAATGAAMRALERSTARPYLAAFAHHLALDQLGRTKEAEDALAQAYRLLLAQVEGLRRRDRRSALERVPEHRAIIRAWEQRRAHLTRVLLPRADAPVGRPLRRDDYVEVVWTIQEAGDSGQLSKRDLRRRRLLRLVQEARSQGASPTVRDLAAALEVSPATVRRDLTALRERGHEVRTRGSRGASN